ncbi:MAG: hypothetical protein IPN26_16430 [Bacteroidetes bacterium]|nr:hypothetical protein [Bacteroidota bacterium]
MWRVYFYTIWWPSALGKTKHGDLCYSHGFYDTVCVHYTYDVYGAFFVQFLLYKAPVWWRNYRNVPEVAPSVSTERIQLN